ncbi:MAG: hypothetical protein K9H26_15105 [Prolixibacteraceae bacterium]|nr:hypothetical protein [Prolixibacteraceae bacterium]
MELDDLKQTWDKLSSDSEKKLQVGEKDIKKLLKKRTLDISEKIGRNIRVGIGIIFGWVCLGFGINFILSPVLEGFLNKPYITEELMFWTFIVEVFNYLLIFIAIILFWVRYNKLEKNTVDINLKSRLQRLIKILNSYKTMFYVVLVIVLLYVIASFSSGFVLSYTYELKQAGIAPENINFIQWLVVAVTFLLVLGVILGIYYLLFNLFFKRLYGRYLKQLKATLRELNETVAETS